MIDKPFDAIVAEDRLSADKRQSNIAEGLLNARGVIDITSYGWREAHDEKQKFVGYAMWALDPPYEHDFDAWQRGTRPQRAPTEQERALMECGHDFFGLMKTARHFIGHALAEQPMVPPTRVESTPFDFAEFAAVAALVAAADRSRDFVITAVLGRKSERRDELDKIYAAIRSQGLGEQVDVLRDLASQVLSSLREARNTVVHGLATKPAQVQRELINRDKVGYESHGLSNRRASVGYHEMLSQALESDRQEAAAVESRVSRLCSWYIGLVEVGGRTFRLEYEWRRRRRERSSE